MKSNGNSEIENTNRVKHILVDFIDNVLGDAGFIDFEHFRKNFKTFLENFSLPTDIVTSPEKFCIFRDLLVDIYSDTPLYLRGDVNKKITIYNNSK